MDNLMTIIGGLNEKELMDVDYVETPESGIGGVSRVFDSSKYGWMRDHDVNLDITCFKRDIKSVLAAMPTAPDNLTAVAGKNNDGTPATRIQWGAGYTLRDITPSSKSASFVILAAKYTKSVPEAQEVYPNGLTINCAGGVYTIVWQGTTFRTFDTGTGSCGTLGVEFVKGSQQKRTVTTYTPDNEDPHVNLDVQAKIRWYDILNIFADGVQMEQNAVIGREEAVGAITNVAYDPAQAEEVIQSIEYLGVTYPAELVWYTESDTVLKLMWSGGTVWEFEL